MFLRPKKLKRKCQLRDIMLASMQSTKIYLIKLCSLDPTLYILRRIFSIHFLMFWWWRAYTCFLSLHGSPSFRNNMKTTAVCCIVFSFIYDSLKHNQSIWKDMKEMIKAVVYVSFICLYIWYWLVIIHCYFSSRETIKHILYQKYKVSFQNYTELRLS